MCARVLVYYVRLCIMRVHACVCVCVGGGGRVCVCVCMRACLHACVCTRLRECTSMRVRVARLKFETSSTAQFVPRPLCFVASMYCRQQQHETNNSAGTSSRCLPCFCPQHNRDPIDRRQSRFPLLFRQAMRLWLCPTLL